MDVHSCAGHLIDTIQGSPTIETPPKDWQTYYRSRGLPVDSPLAALLTFPLTVFHVLDRLGLAGSSRKVSVHVLGPEKELFLLPLFRELAVLMPAASLSIDMSGCVQREIHPAIVCPPSARQL